MHVLRTVFVSVLLVLSLSSCSGVLSGDSDQIVDNKATMQYLRELNKNKSVKQKLNNITMFGCATDISLIGVTGGLEENPLLRRLGTLHRMYERQYDKLSNKSGVPANLTRAEMKRCPTPEMEPFD